MYCHPSRANHLDQQSSFYGSVAHIVDSDDLLGEGPATIFRQHRPFPERWLIIYDLRRIQCPPLAGPSLSISTPFILAMCHSIVLGATPISFAISGMVTSGFLPIISLIFTLVFSLVFPGFLCFQYPSQVNWWTEQAEAIARGFRGEGREFHNIFAMILQQIESKYVYY